MLKFFFQRIRCPMPITNYSPFWFSSITRRITKKCRFSTISYGLPLSFSFLYSASHTFCEEEISPNRSLLYYTDAIEDIMKSAGAGFLVTVGFDGSPHARVVEHLNTSSLDIVWIGTNVYTRKVKEIQKNPLCTIAFYDKNSISYVTLTGHASIISSPSLLQKHWPSNWSLFITEGPQGGRFALIKLIPHRIEIVSVGHEIAQEPNLWRPYIFSRDTSNEDNLSTWCLQDTPGGEMSDYVKRLQGNRTSDGEHILN